MVRSGWVGGVAMVAMEEIMFEGCGQVGLGR